MDETQIQFILPSLIFLFLLWITIKNLSHTNKNPPPSPPKLPLIGNLHQLGSLPHKNLQSLARKHGPIMLLHFGPVPVLIASSADAAREITKTHDLIFASRPLNKVSQKLSYNGRDVVFAPYGEYWRRAKSVLMLQLLSGKRVQSYRLIREEETALLVKRILECSGPVNLSEMFSEFTNDGICRSAFGRKYSDSESGRKFLELVGEVSEVIGAVRAGEFLPWLSWMDRVSGFDGKVDRIAREMDEFLEGVMRERLGDREGFSEGKEGDNFLDILLGIYSDSNGEVSVDDTESIKAILLDVFAAGTDTTSVFLEWAMTELLRNPTVMQNLQNEVRETAKDSSNITEDDLERMHYLKAVIKETLRYHPPVPLLVPRVASKDVKIKGYDVAAGTVVMINAWAIGRDSVSWNEPEEFKPERFLNSSIDFKGLNFELVPFGMGRRACPGAAFAVATIEFVLASLVQKFDWKLDNGGQGGNLDMSERQGITVHRDIPLIAVASLSK
ncbi:cytochrome P450 71A8-like [Salvia hispanica]|uniref:cytochrome P450 71A8-like n=1 Tax=Salvia hispanica TaxID=49212 RepID=UPI002009C016|nr:cytochrome P450 71A8-like [Salvia hispanica]